MSAVAHLSCRARFPREKNMLGARVGSKSGRQAHRILNQDTLQRPMIVRGAPVRLQSQQNRDATSLCINAIQKKTMICGCQCCLFGMLATRISQFDVRFPEFLTVRMRSDHLLCKPASTGPNGALTQLLRAPWGRIGKFDAQAVCALAVAVSGCTGVRCSVNVSRQSGPPHPRVCVASTRA